MAGTIHIPNALTVPSTVAHTTAFPQSGSWNFFDITARTVTASVGALQRYAAGRVNPYTVVVARGLCTAFRLRAVGRKNIEDALSKLSAVGSLGQILYFGFGVEDLVRSLAQSEEGAICLALCAALREIYQEDVAVEILLELARMSSVPGELMPSSFEWKNLLNACSGVLATSLFPLRAETIMRLAGRGQRLGAFGAVEATPGALRSCSNPKSLASALVELARVTSEDGRSITFVGCADAGWLVALAEWLFDCSVMVMDMDGNVTYQNRNDEENVQVKFVFCSSNEERVAGSLDLELREKFCLIEDASKLFREAGRSVDAHVVSGRVDWAGALSSAYMDDFKILMRHQTKLGDLIGSAARIFEAIAEADIKIPRIYRVACASYCQQSYGGGFIHNIVSWFPELRGLKDRMQMACKSTLEDALRTYESCIISFRDQCQCKTCEAPHTGFDVDQPDEVLHDDEMDITENELARNDSNEDFDDWDSDKFCLVVLTETIICLSRILAHLDVQKDLLPVRSGFEIAFGRQLNLRRSSNLAKHNIKEMGQIIFCLDFDNAFSWAIEEDAAEARLFPALELFTGRTKTRRSWGVSAQCSNGICAFLNILQDISVDKNDIGRIGILSGRIEFETKSYTTLEDERLPYYTERGDFASMMVLKGKLPQHASIKLRIKEGPNSLECSFVMKDSQGDLDNQNSGHGFQWFLGPAKGASMC